MKKPFPFIKEKESYREQLVKKQPIMRIGKNVEKNTFYFQRKKILVFSILMLEAIISQWIPEVFSLELRQNVN